MKQKPNYFAILTSDVRYDKNLSSSAKLLYAEITALSNKEGFCWASNGYFSELYDVNNSTVSLWIKNLAECGYIHLEYIYEGKQIIQRNIYPVVDTLKSDDTYLKNQKGVFEKSKEGIEKIERGYLKNTKDNNTINNTSNNIINKETEFPDSIKEISNFLLDSIIRYDNTHRYSKKRPNINRWHKDIDKAIRIDGRTEEQLMTMIDFIFSKNLKCSSFWASNINSGAKLRDKFDIIKNQIKSELKNGRKPISQETEFLERI